MNAPHTPFTPSWQAELELGYACLLGRTVPVHRKHLGPLRVQKHLHAEGPGVCQHIIVHPPGGIAGGDRLNITATVGENAWAQLTSPGAAKWYRAAAPAHQRLRLRVEAGATLEWLPQETIVYSAAQAHLDSRIDLLGDARLCYWDVIALGRPASGERFDLGHLQARLEIRRDGRLLWHERQRVEGGDGLLDSPIGLDGQPVFATLIVTGEADAGLLERCRELATRHPGLRADLTQLPGLLLGRCLAAEALHARAWLIDLWHLLRPALLGRDAVPPRIWST
ncbi:urease accessory protein UreD [Stutzerimonas kirkiae]|uniref:Urease accessory protein UreD n=1 Tax=Stutzerimonas kirkiae TaxID=2211392 RepID=A0A4Q9QZ86_9GAMM|nr:urease accessory protein UreD [Stutzerimonas kirkiae]TBU90640.1 urease accessory protein [Stutzerimonas kirkiae]TBV00152.1 urease accessory protein [Stutzerimonas kirkiae]TBV04765.1 urease accessory protein [Stutzerimonas kirkiae]